MIKLPVIRWGQPYESLEVAEVNHFATGEPIAKVCQANGGIIKRDMRQAARARDVLRQFSCRDLIAMLGKAADLYERGTLPMGDGTQSPDDFVHQQSASTGLPEHMCRANMAKNSFVLKNMEKILECLTRGLDLENLSRGFGEEGRGVVVSYQAQSPVLAAVLPSNSPGVHTLWLPVVALQMGLVLKPGPQEPWTPYRIFAAFTQAGVPREAFALYARHLHGPHSVLAVHVSNRYLDLEDIVQAGGATAGFVTFEAINDIEDNDSERSTWMLLARDPAALAPFGPLRDAVIGVQPWTDASSNLLQALNW